ncbi:AbiTii domain-containing protein [Rhodococcoides fascians]|uniref:AbiTii domain-containing protein n=1 Tax=Rhodococcoides fascians TaxID=1828 RepID=UPI002781C9D5|nr:hypothetical protein [Rhodococcus fascians]MDQ0284783.1 hypothetical protein [Rhodococcus fascians]
MTFLLNFIDAAQGETPLSVLLRKMKVLGAFTGTPELTKWANLEINGYPENATLPIYRESIPIRPLGHFIAPFGSETMNVPIPSTTFPEEARNSSLFRLTLNQGIAELEGYIDDKVTNFAWTADTVVMYNGLVKMGKVQRIMESSFGLVNATYSIPSAQFKGVLDAIRNKALDLALELYAAAPEAGEATAGPSTNNVARDTIIQFITYNFPSADLSGSNNAFGSSEFAQAQAPSPSQEPEH